jgi:hypothetical protein
MNTIPSSLSKEEILIEGAALALFRRYNPKMNPESGIGKKLMKGFLRDAKTVLEYAAQQLQPPGTSDAVEFARFCDDLKINADRHFNIPREATTEELYQLFLQTKQSGMSATSVS